MFDGSRVKIGPGTLYAAPLGTTEPTSVTGAWPTGWTSLGYTDQGSEFDFGPQVAPVEVEEELWPVKQAITSYAGHLMFVLAEMTRQMLALVLNAGIGSSTIAASQGTESDGSVWQGPPSAGSEVRVMLGWDAIPKGASTGLDPYARLVVRQCLQVGTVKRMARKGNNKSTFQADFAFEKPASTECFVYITTPQLAS